MYLDYVCVCVCAKSSPLENIFISQTEVLTPNQTWKQVLLSSESQASSRLGNFRAWLTQQRMAALHSLPNYFMP